jgi:general secretion pathway protein C
MVSMEQAGLGNILFNVQKALNQRITVIGVTGLLACYFLWQAGSLVWEVWFLNHGSSQAATAIAPSSRHAGPESLQDVLRYPLIHAAANTAAQASVAADRPKTSLNLKLVGLMYSTDQRQARAIIESEEDGARSYAIHERIAGKAEIYGIEADRVILLHAGRQEALLLSPQPGIAEIASEREKQPPNPAGGNEAAAQNAGNTPQSMDDLMRDFSATPVMENGQLMGFHITAVRNPQLMNEWGIGPDDVITAVNGTPLNSAGRIMILYDKLKKQKEFELTLNNGGKSRIITVDANE